MYDFNDHSSSSYNIDPQKHFINERLNDVCYEMMITYNNKLIPIFEWLYLRKIYRIKSMFQNTWIFVLLWVILVFSMR